MTRLGRTALFCYSVITLVTGCIPLFKWEEWWQRADKTSFFVIKSVNTHKEPTRSSCLNSFWSSAYLFVFRPSMSPDFRWPTPGCAKFSRRSRWRWRRWSSCRTAAPRSSWFRSTSANCCSAGSNPRRNLCKKLAWTCQFQLFSMIGERSPQAL